MKKKILYLFEQPFDERNYQRFGINRWFERGWDVEMWDLTSFYYPYVWKDFLKSGREIKKIKGYKSIYDLYQLIDCMNNLESGGYYFDFTGTGVCQTAIKLWLKHKKWRRVNFSIGSIPPAVIANKYHRIFQISCNNLLTRQYLIL